MANIKTFAKGDWIVHVNYGVGQVKGLERKGIAGKDTLYYRIENDSSTFWLPVSRANTKRVRPIVTKRKLTEAIRLLKDTPQEVFENHKQRENWIKETRLKGALRSTVCLVRDLFVQDSKKKLSPREQDILEDLKKQVVMEWSAVLDIKPFEARSQLENLLASHLV